MNSGENHEIGKLMLQVILVIMSQGIENQNFRNISEMPS